MMYQRFSKVLTAEYNQMCQKTQIQARIFYVLEILQF